MVIFVFGGCMVLVIYLKLVFKYVLLVWIGLVMLVV